VRGGERKKGKGAAQYHYYCSPREGRRRGELSRGSAACTRVIRQRGTEGKKGEGGFLLLFFDENKKRRRQMK